MFQDFVLRRSFSDFKEKHNFTRNFSQLIEAFYLASKKPKNEISRPQRMGPAENSSTQIVAKTFSLRHFFLRSFCYVPSD